MKVSQFGCYQGYSQAVYDGYQRQSNFKLDFDLLPTSYRFLEGQRIRIAIAFSDASNFDTHVLDPPPTLKLLRNPNHPSYVELPVIKNPWCRSVRNEHKKENIPVESNSRKRTKRNLLIFIVLVLGSAVLAGVIEPLTIPPGSAPGTSGLGQLLWLVAPLAIMLGLRTFGGDGWGDFGLRPNFKGNGFWWLVNFLVYPLVITMSVLIGALVDGLELDVNMSSAFVTVLLTGLVSAMIKNVFEEFAWRGYLAPKVYSLNMNIWLSHAIVGLVWGAWHLPFIFVFWPYLTADMLWYFIPLLLLGTISHSVVYGEIRLATGSVLPAWVMHTIGNTLGNALLLSGFIQLVPGWEPLVSPGAEGVVGIVLMSAIGYWLYQRRRAGLESKYLKEEPLESDFADKIRTNGLT